MSTPCPKLTFMHALATSMFTMVLTVALVYTYLFTIVNMDPELGKLRFWALFRMLGMDIAPDGFGAEERVRTRLRTITPFDAECRSGFKISLSEP
jgi:hypothetical protein